MPTDPNQLELDLDLPPRDERKETKVIPLPVRYEGPPQRRRLRRARASAHATKEPMRELPRLRPNRRLVRARRLDVPPLRKLQTWIPGRPAEMLGDSDRRNTWSDEVPDWVPGPCYQSLAEAPREQVEWAATKKLPWVYRFVIEGRPTGTLMSYARAYAAALDIPRDEIPAYSTLNLWAHQYWAYGLLGLVRTVHQPVGSTGGRGRQEADHG